MSSLLSVHWVLVASIWYFGNGLLHDAFVLAGHKEKYNRELLRLLMDGHVLIVSGVVMFVGYLMIRMNATYSPLLCGVVAGGMFVYCCLIFPFLKSFATMAISMMVILVCIYGIWK